MNSGNNEDIHLEQRGALHVVTLNRVNAKNAISIEMREALDGLYPKAARDPMSYAVAIRSSIVGVFSAGGDMKEFARLAQSDLAQARAEFGKEYFLNWKHECFSKPTISLIDGIVMGSGVGLTSYGTHRVGGERYQFAMPETAIGFFPDVGVAHLFSRMPDHIGEFLALTGYRIGRATAYRLGLLTHCISAAHFDEIIAEIADVQPVDQVLDSRHQNPGECELREHLQTIRSCFSADHVEGIISRLDTISGSDQPWAQDVKAQLLSKSPLALKVTLQHVRASKERDLRQTLVADYTLAARFLDSFDLAEGIRAVLIDRDQKPAWQPAKLEDVTSDMVNSMFQPIANDTFELPTREDMQSARS